MAGTNSNDRISHESDRDKGVFFIERNGKRIAELTYLLNDGVADLDHTEVDAALRGAGTGGRMIEAAVQWARDEGVTLLPTCPYAKAVFDKTPAYADVREAQ